MTRQRREDGAISFFDATTNLGLMHSWQMRGEGDFYNDDMTMMTTIRDNDEAEE